MVRPNEQLTADGDSPATLSAHRLIFEITRALIDDESPIAVEVVNEAGSTTLQVRTDARGLGRLIGQQGRTVRAIRTILTAFASRLGAAYSLDIRPEDAPDA